MQLNYVNFGKRIRFYQQILFTYKLLRRGELVHKLSEIFVRLHRSALNVSSAVHPSSVGKIFKSLASEIILWKIRK